jgi:hypothetical protein
MGPVLDRIYIIASSSSLSEKGAVDSTGVHVHKVGGWVEREDGKIDQQDRTVDGGKYQNGANTSGCTGQLTV